MEDPAWWDGAGRGFPLEQYSDADHVARMLEDRAALEAQPVLRLEEMERLEPPGEGFVLLRLAIAFDGALLGLWCAERDRSLFDLARTAVARRTQRWPGSRAERPAPVILARHHPSGATRVLARLPELEVTYPHLQTTADGDLLVVGHACVLTADGPERNALRIDGDGAIVERATLGDGVGHLQTTASGAVWVGYADTGIFGNNGWGERRRDGPSVDPIGSMGLLRFDDALQVEWEFGRAEYEAGVRDRVTIDHVYALNIVDDTAWAFIYSRFAIVRVEHDVIDLWDTDVTGAGVLLVSDDRQALVGGYGPEFDRIVVGHLEPGRFVRDATMRLVLPDGSDVPPSARFLGRGPVLHVAVDDRWFRWTL